MIKPLLGAVLLALCAHAAPLAAQNVYRCGESYSNQPCPGARVVPTDDPRSAVQRAETDAATRRDAKSAEVMEKERLRQEGKPAQATIPAIAPQAPPAAGEQARPKLKKPELFTAVAPRKPGEAAQKPKKKKKAAKKAAA